MTLQMQMAVSDVSEVLFARKYAYDILRRFFLEEPSQEYLKPFVQRNMINQFPFLYDSPGIQEGVWDIQKYLQQHDVVNNKVIFEDLHWDFTRMTIGPFELTVPPWESYYTRKNQLLFQELTMDVRRTYKKFNYEVKEFNLEADDHIGLELDFMYHLNSLALQLENSSSKDSVELLSYLLQEQDKFLKKHLLKFGPTFSNNMIKNAETGFYIGMAKILKHFLTLDSEVLHELLNIEIVQKN
ncbi:molecular chaperone TorD family protein [Bacillaceae bacterium S4-13-56]